jgi:membrane fusion protein, multidrug efflux system
MKSLLSGNATTMTIEQLRESIKHWSPGRQWLAVLALPALTACTDAPDTKLAEPLVRPALIEQISLSGMGAKLRFPGRVRSEKRAVLSFGVPGVLVEFALPEGAKVRAGEFVAKLDDKIYRARVDSAQAEFDRARTDLERYERLWDSERAVARAEVDDRRSRLEGARTNLASAQQDLADTLVRAPFDGVITRRHVENFASVQAKQAIADLQDPRKLEIVINVPERVFRNETHQKQGQAIFEGQETAPLPLTLKSFSAEADAQTQTYEVVLSLSGNAGQKKILPGMLATVMPFGTPDESVSSEIWVPLTAIVSDASNQRFVWRVDQDGVVSRSVVTTAEIRGGLLRVQSGLADGDRIVTAGVHALREGMKVRPLDTHKE